MGYLAAVSRKLEQPLAIVVQSSSAAGKSALREAVLALMPEEERVQYSAMTGQSLFYMGETDLKHKILAIAEEEGAERASYALKLLQSEGKLTIASSKDPQTGKLVTHEYHVEGPVMIFLTTTAIEVDEELLNRCIVLTVDEGPRADARDPSAAARIANARRPARARAARREPHPHAPSQRAAPPAADPRGQPIRARAHVHRRPHAIGFVGGEHVLRQAALDTCAPASGAAERRSRGRRSATSVGVAASSYTDPDCTGKPIKRVHVTELQERMR